MSTFAKSLFDIYLTAKKRKNVEQKGKMLTFQNFYSTFRHFFIDSGEKYFQKKCFYQLILLENSKV